MTTKKTGGGQDLYIPVHTLDSNDYIVGFGQLEVIITAVALVIGVILGIIISTISGNTFFLFVLSFFTAGITFVVIRRDQRNENMITKIRIILRFRKAQKKYLYEYYNIHEGREIDIES